MTSPDGSHFAFLDIHCSIGVYKGDVEEVIRHLVMTRDIPDLTNLHVELKYRTEGFSSLQGQCFAGLDETGRFSVYSGHPESPNYTPVWSTGRERNSNNVEEDSFYSAFTRYYLELSSTGELAVRCLTPGNSDSECLWSTTSCNMYLAALKDLHTKSTTIVRESIATGLQVFEELKDLIRWIIGLIKDPFALQVQAQHIQQNVRHLISLTVKVMMTAIRGMQARIGDGKSSSYRDRSRNSNSFSFDNIFNGNSGNNDIGNSDYDFMGKFGTSGHPPSGYENFLRWQQEQQNIEAESKRGNRRKSTRSVY